MSKKILVVDDDRGICTSFTLLLREEGYDVTSTTDSREAAILIKKDRYDLCFFDYKMPCLNGIDLLRITKNVSPQCLVFIVSGMLNIDELCKKEVKAELLAGIINKPFDIEKLLQRIADIVK